MTAKTLPEKGHGIAAAAWLGFRKGEDERNVYLFYI